ncbi:MAG: 3-deoxy-manno-octulosonate-8-phosphatase KdsC [Gammaproteobacteria bacterium]|nr:3-deoxy-manno-octulosonate-8-phosphatase KdsC [Gammaproteobacteria bacterium]
MQEIIKKAAKIKLIIFDVDGVLTDGSLYIDDNGMEYKAFYSRDGLGMKMIQETNVKLAVITGRTSELVSHRMNNLGIKYVYQGQSDKIPAFEKLKNDLQLESHEIAFVGDDVIDLPVMNQVGLSVAVQDAHPLVIQYAHWRTPSAGGRGAARDICELIMEAQNTLADSMNQYLNNII